MGRSLTAATPEERDALRLWTTGRHREIQAALRGQLPATVEITAIVRQMDAALARDPLPFPTRLQRITGRDTFPPGDLAMLVNRSRRERGYLAATINAEPPAIPIDDPMLMRITARRDTPAAYLATVSMVGSQREVLLARGLEMLVTGARYDSVDRRWEVDVYVRP